MSRIAYVNGRYVPHARALIHIEDRGLQFADSVYEVITLQDRRMLDATLHLARLDRSLAELRIAAPLSPPALRTVLNEMIARNRRRHGLIYLQISRGIAPRNHFFPQPGTSPSLIVTLRAMPPMPASLDMWTATAITMADERWGRCDIKTTNLLPNVLARQAAREAGASEAILIARDGMVTEGAATSVWIVDDCVTLRTTPLSHAILPGCTREALGTQLEHAGIAYDERAFSLEELRAAREIFLTSASSFIKPVLKLDGVAVGQGSIGPIARQLFTLFARHMQDNATL